MTTKTALRNALAFSAMIAAAAVCAQGTPATAPDLGKHTANPATANAGAAHDMSKHGMDMQGSSASMDMHKVMMQHDMSGMKMTGDTDRDFASMMIMHHEQGIRMMDIEIKQGKNAALKAMATRMKAQQTKEIAELKKYR